MHRKLKEYWDKHEGWAAPLAMVFFLVTGLQIGVKIGDSRTNELDAESIRNMQDQLQEKDAIIVRKDARIRELQDFTMKSKDTTDAAITKATDAAKAAAQAAEAASKSAEAAATAAEKPAR